jgi:aryl-alcohol dehydrogenase-like predicted oxidoreductase
MNFGDSVDERLAGQMLDVSFEAGVTVVDTANAYSGGACEQMLGRLIPGQSDSHILATKVGILHEDAKGEPPLSRTAILNSISGSLSRLKREKIDLYYLHAPDRLTEPRESIETLRELHLAQKISAWGFSNYSAWQALELITLADEVGLPRPIVGQQLYSAVSRKIEIEYLEFSRKYDLHLMVYNPLAGGLLSGKHKFEELPEKGRFGSSKLAEMYVNRYWSEDLFDAISALQNHADELGIGLPELSFRWLLAKPEVGSILIGASSMQQLVANLAAASAAALEAKSLEVCNEIGGLLSGPMANYNR